MVFCLCGWANSLAALANLPVTFRRGRIAESIANGLSLPETL